MTASKLTSKGQCVVPKPIRDHLHLHPGDRVDFVVSENGEVRIEPVVSDVGNLKGLLHKPGREPVSLEQMDDAIRRRGGTLP